MTRNGKTGAPRLACATLAAGALLAAASPLALASTPGVDAPEGGTVLRVATWGEGPETRTGTHSFDIGLADMSRAGGPGLVPDATGLDPVHDLGTVRDTVRLAGAPAGVTGIDMESVFRGTTMDMLHEWDSRGWVRVDGLGYSYLTVTVRQHAPDGMTVTGGWDADGDRTMLASARMQGSRLLDVTPLAGYCTPTDPAGRDGAADDAYAFCDLPVRTVSATATKRWENAPGGTDPLREYADRFTFSLDTVSAVGGIQPVRPAAAAPAPSSRTEDGESWFPRTKDVRWDTDGTVDFGTARLPLADMLSMRTRPLDPPRRGDTPDMADGEGRLWALDRSRSGIQSLAIDLQVVEHGTADGVTPSGPVGVRLTKAWDPLRNAFTVSDRLHAVVTNTVGALPAGRVTVTFDPQTRDADTPAPLVLHEGDTATAPTATRPGWALTGWYEDPACTHRWDFSTPVTHDLTLYAGWRQTRPDTVTVTFDPQAEGVTPPAPLTIDRGDAPGTLPSPRRDGWRFDGWHLDPEGTLPFDPSTRLDTDLTLYAAWTRQAAPTAKDDTPAAASQRNRMPATGAGILAAVSAAVLTAGAGLVLAVRARRR